MRKYTLGTCTMKPLNFTTKDDGTIEVHFDADNEVLHLAMLQVEYNWFCNAINRSPSLRGVEIKADRLSYVIGETECLSIVKKVESAKRLIKQFPNYELTQDDIEWLWEYEQMTFCPVEKYELIKSQNEFIKTLGQLIEVYMIVAKRAAQHMVDCIEEKYGKPLYGAGGKMVAIAKTDKTVN
jgi:hypothetical protein